MNKKKLPTPLDMDPFFLCESCRCRISTQILIVGGMASDPRPFALCDTCGGPS